jgi:hypothetical protein
VLNDIPWKVHNVERPESTSKVVGDFDVEESTKIENVDATECVTSNLEPIGEASVVLTFQSNSIFSIVFLSTKNTIILY